MTYLLIRSILNTRIFQILRHIFTRILFLREFRFGRDVPVDGLVGGSGFFGFVVGASGIRRCGGCVIGWVGFGIGFEAVDFFFGLGDVLGVSLVAFMDSKQWIWKRVESLHP